MAKSVSANWLKTLHHFNGFSRHPIHTAPDFFLIIRLHGSLRPRQQNCKMAAIHDFPPRRMRCRATLRAAQGFALRKRQGSSPNELGDRRAVSKI